MAHCHPCPSVPQAELCPLGDCVHSRKPEADTTARWRGGFGTGHVPGDWACHQAQFSGGSNSWREVAATHRTQPLRPLRIPGVQPPGADFAVLPQGLRSQPRHVFLCWCRQMLCIHLLYMCFCLERKIKQLVSPALIHYCGVACGQQGLIIECGHACVCLCVCVCMCPGRGVDDEEGLI